MAIFIVTLCFVLILNKEQKTKDYVVRQNPKTKNAVLNQTRPYKYVVLVLLLNSSCLKSEMVGQILK
ncbi:hypothetical protein M472_00955 [Sphingobacterium paucimobilis HER1398]|uniref:Uncharacterized protein n=1 Tax=Sphingobacterium paucimobilis HER1398 TaxID=1346330 RepID=U2IX90_9SPHI|nr:hypothetical protein M472_00955 [Sphingobacterium paucimobilis HER1398]